ncbi:MAG TPA: PRC-barrel domain-containing protein [Acidimicrobiales bacterium]
MRRFAEVLGLPVVSATTAERLGTVAALVVDPAGARVASVRVSGGPGEFVSWEDLRGVGPDAVVVAADAAIRSARPGLEERAAAGVADLIGKRVLTDAGTEVGTVADVEFDPETGLVTTVLAGDRRLPGAALRGVGPYAVVVRDAGLEEPPTAAPS